MDVFRITKPHIYALFRTSIILKNHVFLKKVCHKVGHRISHSRISIGHKKTARISPSGQLEIVGFSITDALLVLLTASV